ncbi:transcriptional repressor LexA [Lachnospiraceae bacterium 54-53]
MKVRNLSNQQQRILDYIKQIILDRGYPPTVREIGKAVGLSSSSSVQSQINKLKDKGYLRNSKDSPRTIEVVDFVDPSLIEQVIKVPLLGTVAAGQPLYAEQNIESYYPIPASVLNNKETFMLNVHGDSMINANILNGDKIIVNVESTAENGDIVVALIEDSATVKRFYKEGWYYRLQPENDTMEPIIVEQVRILGKVIGVMRLGIH